MSERIEALALQVDAHLSGSVRRVASPASELAYEVEPAALLSVCRTLRDTPELKFEMLVDLAGVDYLHYGRDEWQTVTAIPVSSLKPCNCSFQARCRLPLLPPLSAQMSSRSAPR